MFCSQILHPPSLSTGHDTRRIRAAIYLNPRIGSCRLYAERCDRQLYPRFFCPALSRRHITDAWAGSQRATASTCCYTPVWQLIPGIGHRPALFSVLFSVLFAVVLSCQDRTSGFIARLQSFLHSNPSNHILLILLPALRAFTADSHPEI